MPPLSPSAKREIGYGPTTRSFLVKNLIFASTRQLRPPWLLRLTERLAADQWAPRVPADGSRDLVSEKRLIFWTAGRSREKRRLPLGCQMRPKLPDVAFKKLDAFRRKRVIEGLSKSCPHTLASPGMSPRKSRTGGPASFKSTPPLLIAQSRASRRFRRFLPLFTRTLVIKYIYGRFR
jgi:hypothetical protein